MHWLKATWRNLFHRELVDSDLDEELRSYRQLIENEKIQSGADLGHRPTRGGHRTWRHRND